MKKKSAVLADKRILDEYDCSVSSDNNIEIFTHKSGWKFQSCHRNILNKTETNQLIHRINSTLHNKYDSLKAKAVDEKYSNIDDDHIIISDYKLHIPPMLFDNDTHIIYHGSNSIRISAGDALTSWAEKHVNENIAKTPLNIIKVPYSSKWMERHRNSSSSDSQSVFNSLIPLTVQNNNKNKNNADINNNDINTTKPLNTKSDNNIDIKAVNAFDWTYSSDYCFSLGDNNDGDFNCNKIISAKEISADDINSYNNNNNNWKIKEIDFNGIDYNLLRQKDFPILYYDEFILYQDDLEDCGEVIFDSKLRVMPNCWFLLNKQYLRVDGVVVRSRETRLFHKFSDNNNNNNNDTNNINNIYIEITWREYYKGHYNSSINNNDNNNNLDPYLYNRELMQQTQALPVVNVMENIKQYFVLEFIQ